MILVKTGLLQLLFGLKNLQEVMLSNSQASMKDRT